MLWPCELKCNKARKVVVGGQRPPYSDNLQRKLLYNDVDMNTAVCFACNEAYIPLCKGLVLSLAEALRFTAGRGFSLHFIDTGCERASLRSLARGQDNSPARKTSATGP